MKIIVLAGGLSPERDVSLSSGSLVANALAEEGHQVLLVDLYTGLPGFVPGKTDPGGLFHDAASVPYSYPVGETEPDLQELRRTSGNGDALIGGNVIEVCRLGDIVFNALHGSMGENGQIQAMLDVLGIKYTGTGFAGSMLAMNKDLSKQLMKHRGIPTADWIVIGGSPADLGRAARDVGYPCVVKPLSGGSSIGVSMAGDERELRLAVEKALEQEPEVLIEKKIEGREFSVGILKDAALPVIEIIPREGFYDYKNKYQPGLTLEVCPAELSPEETRKVQAAALEVHRLLRLGSYSRIDFILDSGGEFYCLEANTLPGMTPTSLIPQEARAAGISYGELCSKIVELSL